MRQPFDAAVGLALLLAGCAINPDASFVQSSASADNAVIATNVASFLQAELPPAHTTLLIEPAASGDQSLLELLREDLHRQGFAIAEPNSGAVAQPVRLMVTPLNGGFAVRIDYGLSEAASYFGRDARGQLQANAPFVRRETTP